MFNFKQIGLSACIASSIALLALSTGSTANAATINPGIQQNDLETQNLLTEARSEGRRKYRRNYRRNSRNHRFQGNRYGNYRNRRNRYSGYRYRNHRYHRGINPGAYVALGVIGALAADGVANNGYGYGRSAMQRCDNRFRSFEWSTGYYTTYGGNKVLCPYLR